MEKLLVKKDIFSLLVYVGPARASVASEIDPILIGQFTDNDNYWDNGPTNYHNWLNHCIYLIKWNDKFHLIESVFAEGDYADSNMNHWQLINELPETLQIING